MAGLKKEYLIDLDDMTEEDVKKIIKDTIEEAKEKRPEKLDDLNQIQISVELAPGRGALALLLLTGFVFPAALVAWNEIVIPLLKKKLKIEPHVK